MTQSGGQTSGEQAATSAWRARVERVAARPAPLDLRGRDRAAVVGERELDDAARLQRPAGELDAARRRAGRGVEARARGAGPSARRRPPGATAPRRGRPGRSRPATRRPRSRRSASPDVGRAAAARASYTLPEDDGALAPGTSPCGPGDDGLAGVEGRGVELARSAEPGRVALGRPGQPELVDARGAQGAERRGEPSGAVLAASPTTRWVASSPMIASTARSATTVPRSHAVPHQASLRRRPGDGVVTGGEDTPVGAAALRYGWPPWPPSSSSPT